MSDPWDAFGDDEDDSSVDDQGQGIGSYQTVPTESLALSLTQYFVKECHISQFDRIRIRVLAKNESNEWRSPLTRRNFTIVADGDSTTAVDVLVGHIESFSEMVLAAVVPGGLVGVLSGEDQIDKLWNEAEYDIANVVKDSGWKLFTKWPAPIQSQTCPWLPAHYDLNAERRRVAEACVPLTAMEREECAHIVGATLSDTKIQMAVQKLQLYGYCVVPGLLKPEASRRFGEIALGDLHHAARVLREREGVDLMEPRNSKKEPASYQELSMREDFRMDLRHGPKLRAWRGMVGSRPWTITALETQERLATQAANPDRFLRGHPVLLEIVRRTTNPVNPALSPGNWGRYNFGGRGPDGSFMDLRAGPVGAIISLPGGADQALHADTPHLTESHDCLPAHYINVFTPGTAADPAVGQTALVHASHRLSFTATVDDNKMSWIQNLVRPSLDLGDVLLFDCRILHFGLANTSLKIERPLLYTNMTQHWFHDPKNWDDRRPIFTENDEVSRLDENIS
eukprot:scaffold572_cov229-Amphora_coffeaeformis.AAC.13